MYRKTQKEKRAKLEKSREVNASVYENLARHKPSDEAIEAFRRKPDYKINRKDK